MEYLSLWMTNDIPQHLSDLSNPDNKFEFLRSPMLRCCPVWAWCATLPRLRWTSVRWCAGPATRWGWGCPVSITSCPLVPQSPQLTVWPTTSPTPLSRWELRTPRLGNCTAELNQLFILWRNYSVNSPAAGWQFSTGELHQFIRIREVFTLKTSLNESIDLPPLTLLFPPGLLWGEARQLSTRGGGRAHPGRDRGDVGAGPGGDHQPADHQQDWAGHHWAPARSDLDFSQRVSAINGGKIYY